MHQRRRRVKKHFNFSSWNKQGWLAIEKGEFLNTFGALPCVNPTSPSSPPLLHQLQIDWQQPGHLRQPGWEVVAPGWQAASQPYPCRHKGSLTVAEWEWWMDGDMDWWMDGWINEWRDGGSWETDEEIKPTERKRGRGTRGENQKSSRGRLINWAFIYHNSSNGRRKLTTGQRKTDYHHIILQFISWMTASRPGEISFNFGAAIYT